MARKKQDQVETSVESKKSEAVKKKKGPQRRETTLIQRALPGLVLMVVVLLLVQAAVFMVMQRTEKAHKEELTRIYRQHYLAMLGSYVHGYEDVVKALPDADLLPYLQPGPDPDMGLVKRFPGVVFARVVPLNLDPAVPNGLSFSHQDMILRLAANKIVTPEISFYESGTIKEQVVSYARLLKRGDGTAAGALLISFPFKTLASSLQGFAPEAGRIELVQKSGSERASILQSGEGVEVPGTDVSTPNPGWEFHFAPATALGQNSTLGAWIIGLGVLAALIAGGLFAWSVRGLERWVKEDIEAVDNFSENFFHYGNRQRPLLHFGVFSSLLAHLDQYGAELRAGRGALRQAPADNLGDINMIGGDDAAELLGSAPEPKQAKPGKAPASTAGAAPLVDGLRPEIFRAYDIRGVVGKGLSKEIAKALGQAIGSEASARGENTVVVGRDGRISGPDLSAALIEGLRASGRDVIDVGMVPTPVLYFAAKTIGTGSGVMVTGSHNPADYNGFKIMLAGDTLAGDDIQALRARIENSDFTKGNGGLTQVNVAQDYVDRVSSDIALARPVTVVVDGGNGVAGPIGTRTLEALGCNVIPLFCEVDGKFPNHHPDPSKLENLEDLMGVVASNNADIGIAFDGDGDRIGVVTANGKNIFPDRLMMLYAKHVLTTNPGADIIFDVKCSRDLPALVSSLGGRPVMCKTGHSFIKGKLKETGAALAGEMSGHIFFNDRWFGFDDAIYSAARLLEILSLEADNSDVLFDEFPENPSTPEINIPVPDESKFGLMEALKYSASFPEANVITIDGVRVEFADSWGLIRASNTTPCLVARFEGKTPEALAEVQEKFKALLTSVDPSLQIPF